MSLERQSRIPRSRGPALFGITALLITASIVSSSPTLGSVAIRLKPSSGPPTSRFGVQGRQFDANETVDVSFDTMALGTAHAGPQGRFTARFDVPALALPGSHAVTATGESSGLTATADFVVRTDWREFQFSAARTGFNPYENVLSATTVGGLHEAWSVSTGGLIQSTPAVVDGVVYIGSYDGSLHAFDAQTGAEEWATNLGVSITYSSPTVVDGVVYEAELFSGSLFALDALTGQILWSAGTGGYISDSPAVSHGLAYIGSANGTEGQLHAFDTTTGAEVWTADVGGNVGLSSPSVWEGLVYVGAADGLVYAFDAATGAAVWTGATGSDSASPAIWNGTVYVASGSGNLIAFDATDGSVKWTAHAGHALAGTAVAEGLVYTTSYDDYNMGALSAFDANTGSLVWKVKANTVSSPMVANGVVYVFPDYPMALDASTGQQLWEGSVGPASGASIVVADGRLYFGSADHNVYAFSLP